MAEPNAPAPSGAGSPNPAGTDANPNPAPAGSVPDTKTDTGSQGFDPSTLSDEDFQKIFGDQRLFTHDRFKALNEKAKLADKLTKEREEAENAQLEKQGKYQELAQKAQDEANSAREQLNNERINNQIIMEASKLGITDVDAATKLIERSSVQVDDSGVVNGVAEAVKALAEAKPYLVGNNTVPTIGSPTNPSAPNQNQGNVQQFKASQIADPAFYREHAKEIDASLKAGVPIIDDRGQAR